MIYRATTSDNSVLFISASASHSSIEPTLANRVSVRVEEHRQQRVLIHARVHQLDHRLQRVVLRQFLLHLRVEEEEAEQIHDQLRRDGDRRLLVGIAVHGLQQIVCALAVVWRRQADPLTALRVRLQTGIQAVNHAHPNRINHFSTEGSDRDLDENRAQNHQAGVHNGVVDDNLRSTVPEKNLREKLEEARNPTVLELQDCLQWNQL